MRIVFFGTPSLAVPSLAALTQGHDVAAVVCQPDRPSGRGKGLTPPPTKVWAIEHGIVVHQPTKLNDGTFAAWLRDRQPDLCALAAYGRILKQPILDAAPHGILNMHPSLLPLYRGPSPIQSALINGATETGVTIIRLSLEMDAGDILLQERVAIGPEDNGETLTQRLAELGGVKLREAVDRVAAGTATFTPQDHQRATYCRLIEKRDGQIDWAKPARDIHNLVRGAQPWPTAHCLFAGQTVKSDEVWCPSVVSQNSGSIALAKKTIFRPAGHRDSGDQVRQTRDAVSDFLRGHPVGRPALGIS